jgi:tetratricopeptide (TPR) repeat protein
MKNFADMSPIIRHWSLVAAFCVVNSAVSFASALSDAQTAFAAADYPAAMRAYEAALSSDGPSAGLYYNLAMTQLRLAQPAEASLSLRRAILLDPQMTDARVALSDLERSQGVPPAPSGWMARWRGIVAEKIPLQALTIAGSVIAWLGAFLMLVAIFRRGRKFWPVTGSFALLAIGKALFFVAYFSDPRVSERQAAVVLAGGGASLLSAPADQSSVVAKVPAGASVHVHRRSGEWSYCETPSGEKGWTATKSLERVVPTA